MELLPPGGWADLTTRTDANILKTDIDIAKTELRIEVRNVRNEPRDLRSELQNLLPRLVVANIASMIAPAGLLLGAQAIA